LAPRAGPAGVPACFSIDLDETLPKDRIETAWTDVRNALDDVRAELPARAGVPELRNEAIDTFTVISVLVPAEAGSRRVQLGHGAQGGGATLPRGR
jgi:hypothetical protein